MAEGAMSAGSGAAGAAASAGTAATALSHTAMRQAQNAYQTAPTPINLPQMAVEIVRHAQQGLNHFQIRLDPADMGRVDVRLAIDSSGTVNAHVTVERAETLSLLQRDSSQLGQALSQSGFDGSKTNLQFSLSQNPFPRQDNGQGTAAYTPPASGGDDSASVDAAGAASAASFYRGSATLGGLNIFV